MLAWEVSIASTSPRGYQMDSWGGLKMARARKFGRLSSHELSADVVDMA